VAVQIQRRDHLRGRLLLRARQRHGFRFWLPGRCFRLLSGLSKQSGPSTVIDGPATNGSDCSTPSTRHTYLARSGARTTRRAQARPNHDEPTTTTTQTPHARRRRRRRCPARHRRPWL
jgi:hypothetical protein